LPWSGRHATKGVPVIKRFQSRTPPFIRLTTADSVSGLVLLAATVIAVLWANSPGAGLYHELWETPRHFALGTASFAKPLTFWVNDALMSIFFLLVGLEIRGEFADGALSDIKHAMLPIVAALGGVAVPAGIFIALNSASPAWKGWAIPTATDIAFAIAALALLGSRIPRALRVLLLAIAIVDDIVAIVVIALFYSHEADSPALGGVHPALIGVLIGVAIPGSAAERIEHALRPWVTFGIVPLFALANAGVDVGSLDFNDPATLLLAGGIGAGLVIGKPVGIVLATALALRIGWCELPPGVTLSGIAVIGCLAGVGFTMSIFIANLAFESASWLATAKTAVLISSTLAAAIGLVVGRKIFATEKR
jgi:NhaA family Na+:H+ antiporter